MLVLLSFPCKALELYGNFATAWPVVAKALTSGVAYLLGDLLAQLFEGGKLDRCRCRRNAAVGFILHGPVLHYWIIFLEGPFAAVLGIRKAWWGILLKILLDQTVFAVVVNTAYALMLAVLAGDPLPAVLRKTRKTLLPAMLSSWRFWPFVHMVTYSPVLPMEFKVLWTDVAEVGWVAILSVVANSSATSTSVKSKLEAPEMPLRASELYS